MKKLLILLGILLSMTTACAETVEQLKARLDSCIEASAEIQKQKEESLEKLKMRIWKTCEPNAKVKLLNQLYDEIYTFKFDSAMVWIDRSLDYASKINDNHAYSLFAINKAELLAIGGFYYEANKLITTIDDDSLPSDLLYTYYIKRYWIETYWKEYSKDSPYEERHYQNKLTYLRKAITLLPKETSVHDYLQAELAYYTNQPESTCLQLYKKAYAKTSVKERLYASCTFQIANIYLKMGNDDEYQKWIIRSAISDQLIPLKENAALQQLTTYLYSNNEENAKLASKYIYVSLKSAEYYNNRLRLLQISQILPTIEMAYQQQIDKQRTVLLIMVIFLCLLAVLLAGVSYYAMKQRNRLRHSHIKVRTQNEHLNQANIKLARLNDILEQHMHLFLDITAIYMDRLMRYKNLVKRKIEAHQEKELLGKMVSEKLANEENEQFFSKFDETFAKLYPTFADEYNQLLKPEYRYHVTIPFPVPVRIAALMRLGICGSSKLATLLAYTPQTIYNYRTREKNKAINKETFDDDIIGLCASQRGNAQL